MTRQEEFRIKDQERENRERAEWKDNIDNELNKVLKTGGFNHKYISFLTERDGFLYRFVIAIHPTGYEDYTITKMNKEYVRYVPYLSSRTYKQIPKKYSAVFEKMKSN